MKQAIGTSTILNIIIIFIVTVFAAITGIISYNKAYKVSTRIGDAIERAEGYNEVSKKEIKRVLDALGYRKEKANCGDNGISGDEHDFCVKNLGTKNNRYQYEVLTYMYFDLPLINEIKIPIRTKTDRIYCFSGTGC